MQEPTESLVERLYLLVTATGQDLDASELGRGKLDTCFVKINGMSNRHDLQPSTRMKLQISFAIPMPDTSLRRSRCLGLCSGSIWPACTQDI